MVQRIVICLIVWTVFVAWETISLGLMTIEAKPLAAWELGAALGLCFSPIAVIFGVAWYYDDKSGATKEEDFY